MSAYSNQGSGNRSRGGRRRPRRGGSGGDNSRPSSTYRPPERRSPAQQKAKKKSLWQKIVSFFSGKPQSAHAVGKNGHTSAPVERKEKPAASQSPRSVRKPEPIEVTSPRIYVGNLSFDASESDLSELFSGVGSVQNVEIVFNKHTQRSKGFGFIQMQSVDEAKRAVDELHDKEYMGRKLVVSGAKAAPDSRPARAQEDDAAPEEEQQSSPAA